MPLRTQAYMWHNEVQQPWLAVLPAGATLYLFHFAVSNLNAFKRHMSTMSTIAEEPLSSQTKFASQLPHTAIVVNGPCLFLVFTALTTRLLRTSQKL